MEMARDTLERLVEILYDRNDIDFKCGTFRVRGDVPIFIQLTWKVRFVSNFGVIRLIVLLSWIQQVVNISKNSAVSFISCYAIRNSKR